MKNKSTFEIIMDSIDENIKEKSSDIRDAIYTVSNYTDMDFNKFLVIATKGEMSLGEYIARCKLYFVAKELIGNPDKPIIDIAYDYNYSQQSCLNRSMNNRYKITPSEIRFNKKILPDERAKIRVGDIKDSEFGKRLKNAIECETNPDCPYCGELDYFDTFVSAANEYGFDTTTCCAISEISERIGLPFGYLLEKLFDLKIEYCDNCGEYNPRAEKAGELDIVSDKELEEICEYYCCEYFHLNKYMVDEYRKL